MTEAQNEQLERAQTLLGEHFDHYSIVVGVDGDGSVGSRIECTARIRGSTSFLQGATRTLIEVLKKGRVR